MSVVAVGDPINVVTGVQFDVAMDARIVWDIPFVWRRHYDSGRSTEYLPLGRGHTHSYDYRLVFDLDGLSFTTPAGVRHGFKLPVAGPPFSIAPAARLDRIGPMTFRVSAADEPELEFEFADAARPARLTRLFRGRASQQLHYGLDGRWNRLTYGREAPVRVHWDEIGRIVALDWDAAPGREAVRLWQAEYDERGNLAGVIDVYGCTQRFSYDAANRMVGRTDRNGFGFTMQYDASGRCVASAGEDGVQAVRLGFHPAEGKTVVARADQGLWEYQHQDGSVVAIVDPYGGVTRRVLGPDGGIAEEVGPEGEVLRARLAPEGTTIGPRYGPPGGPSFPIGDPWFAEASDKARPRHPIGWDGFGTGRDVAGITFPLREAALTWSEQLPATVLDALRFSERRRGGNPPAPRWAGAADWRLRDGPAPKKRMLWASAPGQQANDPYGLPISHELPDGSRARWRYDPNGNVVRYIDHAGASWRFDYASWNLLVQETDPLGHRSAYTYNAVEQCTQIADANGTATRLDYDLKDRLVARYRDGVRRDAYRYDLSTGLVAASDEDDKPRVTMLPGPHGRPLLIQPRGRPPRQCQYDDTGRLVSVAEEEGGSLAFAYNRIGQRMKDFQDGRGAERRYRSMRLSELAVLERFVTRYQHAEEGNGWTITDPTGGRHSVRVLAAGLFLVTRSNGVKEVAQYDWLGRCVAKSRWAGRESFAIRSRCFRYSPVGALLTATESASGNATYSYDGAHRLIAAARPRGATEHYVYDAAGHLLQAPGLRDAAYAGNRLISANGRRFVYNTRDNLSAEWDSDRAIRYRYDSEDRLVACENHLGTIAFSYDALGRRLTKTVGHARTSFIWDGERLAAEIGPQGALRLYLYASEDAMSPFAFIDYASVDSEPASGVLMHIFTDQVARPERVEDAEGRARWRASFDAYGAANIRADASVTLNLRWPGHYFDPETGLHYNRHRYYSPTLCRYLQVDPRDIEGGLNLYAYPARPLDTVDVDGLAPCPKKPILDGDDSQEFKDAKEKADRIAQNMEAEMARLAALGAQAIKDGKHPSEYGGIFPGDHHGTTLATMVVKRNGQWEVVVTGSQNPARMPASVRDQMEGARQVGYGDIPAGNRVTQNDDDWRFPRTRPDGSFEPTTHHHAEQRGLRAVDCDQNSEGVAYIAPTRPCCPGCNSAVQTPTDQGGWDGTRDNISPRGTDRSGWTFGG